MSLFRTIILTIFIIYKDERIADEYPLIMAVVGVLQLIGHYATYNLCQLHT